MLPAGKIIELGDDVHVIPDGGVALVPNVGIVLGDDSVLVIDTGMGPANAEIVLAEVRGMTRLPIRYLVTTHFHPEHNYGAQAFPDETILVYATAQHRDLQRKGEAYRTWFIEMFGDDVRELLQPVELREPDLTFEKRVELNLGGRRVELHYFGQPAHTGGDTVVYLPRQKIAFVGDLVPNGRFPILPDEDSSIRGWIETLDALAALGAETIVPSHGPPGKADLIQEVRDYLTAIEMRAGRLRSDGVALETAQDTLFGEFTGRYPDWAEPNWIRNAVERAYAEAAAR
jgi:glyoxylase-like metal-dependent hydrolase (beta-lactamase superfamily II)